MFAHILEILPIINLIFFSHILVYLTITHFQIFPEINRPLVRTNIKIKYIVQKQIFQTITE